LSRIAGVDEAGRGPLAGPVVVAACILPPFFVLKGLNDSKQLSEKKREEFFEILTKVEGVEYAISIIGHEEIDEINILQATLKGMKMAVEALKLRPTLVLIDGNRVPSDLEIPSKAIIGGDATEPAISAASVIAKVTRDRLMREYHEKYPSWEFAKHKGYGTKLHFDRLKELGLSPIHRKTFTKAISL